MNEDRCCPGCKKIKPTREFCKNRKGERGQGKYCESCQRWRRKASLKYLENARKDPKRKAQLRKRTRKYDKTKVAREKRAKNLKQWRMQNRDKNRVHTAVANAIRREHIKRGPCEREGKDCHGPICAHHDDYSRPLDIRWLCTQHHAEVHKEKRRSNGSS